MQMKLKLTTWPPQQWHADCQSQHVIQSELMPGGAMKYSARGRRLLPNWRAARTSLPRLAVSRWWSTVTVGMSEKNRRHRTNWSPPIGIGICTRSITSVQRARCSKATSRSIGFRVLTPCSGTSEAILGVQLTGGHRSAPSGAVSIYVFPGLTPWATFSRRFAAKQFIHTCRPPLQCPNPIIIARADWAGVGSAPPLADSSSHLQDGT